MKTFFSDPGHNKAAMILAAMSPDMVADIVDLCTRYGRSVQSAVAAEDGPPRPLAVLSRDYISDADFPYVFYGFASMVLADFRTLKQDNDFYEKVLMNAFSLPSEIAGPAAKKIETYDVLGGGELSKEQMAWYSKIGAQLQEGVRRIANTAPKVLGIPWENDQTQQYDIDFLYELSLLGRAVDEFQARARLMKGQAALSTGMGLFLSSSGKVPYTGSKPGGDVYGDIYGDIYGDPADVAEVMLSDAAKPLIGGILPPGILGGLAKLFKFGKQASEKKVDSMVARAQSPNADPSAAGALERLMTGAPGVILAIDSATSSLGQVKAQLASLMGSRETAGHGDVYSHVSSMYGDVVADCWNRGDVPGALSGIVDLAGDAFETTGDPELDEAIIGDVINEVVGELGDVEGADLSEMGGLFTRARANAKMRRAKRRERKAKKRQMRQDRKDAKVNRLVDADRQASQADWQATYDTGSELADNSLASQDGSYAADPQYFPQFNNNGYQVPDDFYNVDSLGMGM